MEARSCEAAGFPGYSIDELAVVRNSRTGRPLSWLPRGQYMLVALRRELRCEYVYVHDLVAKCFTDILGPRPPAQQTEGFEHGGGAFIMNREYLLSFRNGNRCDPRLCNLYWELAGAVKAQVFVRAGRHRYRDGRLSLSFRIMRPRLVVRLGAGKVE